MSKGFQSTEADDLKIQAIVRRLLPAVTRKDEFAIATGLKKMVDRYGEELVSEAFTIISADNPWLFQSTLNKMLKSDREEFAAQAIEFLAETITDAGLRLEDHLRVADRGIAVTHEAVETIRATGFPRWEEFGGNETLEGMGIGRSPYIHHLAEFSPDLESMNFWALASLTISAAQGWIPDEDASSVAAEDIRKLIFTIAPTTDLSKLLYRSRYDDSALVTLTNLLHQAVTDPRSRSIVSEFLRDLRD